MAALALGMPLAAAAEGARIDTAKLEACAAGAARDGTAAPEKYSLAVAVMARAATVTAKSAATISGTPLTGVSSRARITTA